MATACSPAMPYHAMPCHIASSRLVSPRLDELVRSVALFGNRSSRSTGAIDAVRATVGHRGDSLIRTAAAHNTELTATDTASRHRRNHAHGWHGLHVLVRGHASVGVRCAVHAWPARRQRVFVAARHGEGRHLPGGLEAVPKP
jgi:hypothetical protein